MKSMWCRIALAAFLVCANVSRAASATSDELRKEARAAAAAGDWRLALSKAEAALALVPSNQDTILMALIASCYVHDQRRATKYAGPLRWPTQHGHDLVKTLCDHEGITIP
jgi:hypothetical protein